MLRWRLVLGVVIVSALVGICWLDYHASRPGIYLLPLAVIVSLLGGGELLAMFRRHQGGQASEATVYGGILITVLSAGVPAILPSDWQNNGVIGSLGWLAIGLAISLLLVFIAELKRFDSPGRATINAALGAFAILYIGVLMGFIVQLRLLGGNETGMVALASLVATVKMSDVGQYTVGRLLGRNKLAPRVSPGKTWEGVAGGVLFAVLAIWLVARFASPSSTSAPSTEISIVALLVFAVAVSAAGIVGDLAESLLKRDAGVKDSSTWLPGFGGVLDLLDSLLGAAPVVYLFWALGLV